MPTLALDVPWLSAATTLHLALAALCSHRHPGHRIVSPLALVSALFAAAPWLFSTPLGVFGGLAVHAVWFGVCARQAVPAAPVQARRPTVPAPALARPSRTADARPKGFVQTPIRRHSSIASRRTCPTGPPIASRPS